MHQVIKQIQLILDGYRAHDGDGSFRITTASIERWIRQFDENDRMFILEEMYHIFKQSYFSQRRVQSLVKTLLEGRGRSLGYADTREFLKDVEFLDCQPDGKSQRIILSMLPDIIKNEFDLEFNDVGNKNKIHCIYIDDVLCTGTTMHNDILNWSKSKADKDKFIDKIRSNEIRLSIMYLAASERAYDKKIGQFYYDFNKTGIEKKFHILTGRWLEPSSLKPIDANQPDDVHEYEAKVVEQANQYANNKGFSQYPEEFYRSQNLVNSFFTSEENRIRIENIFLNKGIEILKKATIIKQNIRPLGFALPTSKNFGFGALFFTWRNIPNNTPLVFWYRGGGFEPLFENVR